MKATTIDVAGLGARIEAARIAKGLTVFDLAMETRIGDGLLRKYEKGITEPGVGRLTLIARALDVTTDSLLGLEVQPQGQTWGGVDLDSPVTTELGMCHWCAHASVRRDATTLVVWPAPSHGTLALCAEHAEIATDNGFVALPPGRLQAAADSIDAIIRCDRQARA